MLPIIPNQLLYVGQQWTTAADEYSKQVNNNNNIVMKRKLLATVSSFCRTTVGVIIFDLAISLSAFVLAIRS